MAQMRTEIEVSFLQLPILILTLIGIWSAKREKILIFSIASTVIYFWVAYRAAHAISRYSFPPETTSIKW